MSCLKSVPMGMVRWGSMGMWSIAGVVALPYHALRHAFICLIAASWAAMMDRASRLICGCWARERAIRASAIALRWCGTIMSMNWRSNGAVVVVFAGAIDIPPIGDEPGCAIRRETPMIVIAIAASVRPTRRPL